MSTAKLEDSTQRPLYGERIIEESKIICFDNPNKKRIYEISIQLPEFTCNMNVTIDTKIRFNSF